ncbi:hypothetical protein ACT7DB_33635 [Bacillus cereus]
MMTMESGSLFVQGYASIFRIIFLQENMWQWGLKIAGATFFTGFSIGCVGKQFIYDFQHKKVSIPEKMTFQIRL